MTSRAHRVPTRPVLAGQANTVGSAIRWSLPETEAGEVPDSSGQRACEEQPDGQTPPRATAQHVRDRQVISVLPVMRRHDAAASQEILHGIARDPGTRQVLHQRPLRAPGLKDDQDDAGQLGTGGYGIAGNDQREQHGIECRATGASV